MQTHSVFKTSQPGLPVPSDLALPHLAVIQLDSTSMTQTIPQFKANQPGMSVPSDLALQHLAVIQQDITSMTQAIPKFKTNQPGLPVLSFRSSSMTPSSNQSRHY